jgi:hypothetical protein
MSRVFPAGSSAVILSAMPETWATLGIMLMGLGGVVAGAAGIALPEGERLGALFALVVGGGVGVAVLGFASLLDEHHEPSEFAFFLASLLGFLTVCVAVWLVRRKVAVRG